MALTAVDKLLAGYLGFVTLLVLARGPAAQTGSGSLLLMSALFATLLYLFTRVQSATKATQALHVLYPLILLAPLYSQIGVLNAFLGEGVVFSHDAAVQHWEEIIFGGQISYTWIRNAPSIFWSGLLHLAYLSYYSIVIVGPALLVLKGRHRDAEKVIFAMMTAFVLCFVVFILYPVAGPNYAFEHPTGPVREVWSARLVYQMLEGGSSFGAAFPSSHVAATFATTVTLWLVWKPMGAFFTIPAVLLVVGTVYCQMHYGIDAAAGLVVGLIATITSAKITNRSRQTANTK